MHQKTIAVNVKAFLMAIVNEKCCIKKIKRLGFCVREQKYERLVSVSNKTPAAKHF